MNFEIKNTMSAVVKKAIALDYEKEELRDYVGISQIGYCKRQTSIYHINKKKKEIDDDVLARFFRGRAIHDAFPSVLWRNRGQIDGYTYGKSEGDISIDIAGYPALIGHYDHAAEFDKKIVVDWKNVDYLNKISEPSQHYVDQLTMYAHGLNIENCALVYFDASTFKSKEFHFKKDAERVEYLIAKYKTIIDAIKTNTPAEKDFSSPEESWQCRYCEFCKDCFPEYEKSYAKVDETIDIDAGLAKTIADLINKKDAIETELDAQKLKLETSLAGKNGKSDYLKAGYIAPTTVSSYDKKLLEKNIPIEDLKKCEKVSDKKGYYRLSVI